MAQTNPNKHHMTTPLSLLRDQRGLSTVEYIIILILIAIMGLVGWKNFGESVKERIEGSDQTIQNELKVPAPSEGD